MAWAAKTPPWVVPPGHAVEDLHWLSYAAHTRKPSHAFAALGVVCVWVWGERTGPITGRDEQPVTEVVARAEMWAASAAERIVDAPLPLDLVYERLGVPHWEPRNVAPAWATAVRATLRWMLGEPDVHGPAAAPMTLPERSARGDLLTAQEMYQAVMAAEPHKNWGPEERAELRNRTGADAIRNERLAALVEDTRRRLSAAS